MLETIIPEAVTERSAPQTLESCILGILGDLRSEASKILNVRRSKNFVNEAMLKISSICKEGFERIFSLENDLRSVRKQVTSALKAERSEPKDEPEYQTRLRMQLEYRAQLEAERMINDPLLKMVFNLMMAMGDSVATQYSNPKNSPRRGKKSIDIETLKKIYTPWVEETEYLMGKISHR